VTLTVTEGGAASALCGHSCSDMNVITAPAMTSAQMNFDRCAAIPASSLPDIAHQNAAASTATSANVTRSTVDCIGFPFSNTSLRVCPAGLPRAFQIPRIQ
jgi:hypothetical protein